MKTLVDLRNHLFTALEGLADKSNPMEIDRAQAIANLGQTIINSAKVEIEHIKLGGKGSGFIQDGPPALPEKPGAPAGTTVIEQRPGVRVTRHSLK